MQLIDSISYSVNVVPLKYLRSIYTPRKEFPWIIEQENKKNRRVAVFFYLYNHYIKLKKLTCCRCSFCCWLAET